MTKTELHAFFVATLNDAHAAGMKAVENTTVTPMVVGTPVNMMASLMGGDDGGFRTDRPVYVVADGPCGFAWLNFRAKRGDGRRFLNFLLGRTKSRFNVAGMLKDMGFYGARTDGYYGGVSMSVGNFGQSMQRKEAYAGAFAAVVNAAGIDGLDYCRSMSRMD